MLSPADVMGLARLADFDPVKSEQRVLMPFSLFGIGRFVNRFISVLPVIRALSLAALRGVPLGARGRGRTEVGEQS